MRSLLILTADAFGPSPTSAASRERALFFTAQSGALAVPDSRHCREAALELVARTGSVRGSAVVYVADGWPGEARPPVDLRSETGVDVGAAVAVFLTSKVSPRSKNGEHGDFVRRMKVLNAFLSVEDDNPCSALERIVLVDRGVRGQGKSLARRACLEDWPEVALTLIDPGPWGLTEGSAAQVCRALGMDAPAPSRRSVQGSADAENLF